MTLSPYAVGFSTLAQEVRLNALPVQGTVPTWLSGRLIRTAPAKFEVGEQAYNHWFDGLAMLHRFSFADGTVSYANRYLRSQSFSETQAKGKISRGEFGTDPCQTLFERVASFFSSQLTDNCNVSVNQLSDDFVAFTETTLPIRFDPDTLETLSVYPYQDRLDGQVSIAHPHFDFEHGCHYSYMIAFGRKSQYLLYRTSAASRQQTLVATLPVDQPAYMHSFGMTERYLVLTEFPLVVNPLRLQFRLKPFIQNYAWEPKRGIWFHIVDKQTGEVIKSAQSASYFAFHHVNAFERDGKIVLDLVAYTTPRIIDQLYLDRLRSDQAVDATGKLLRFNLDLAGGAEVVEEILSETPIELPRINYRQQNTRPYRYVYGVSDRQAGDFLDSLVKLDLEQDDTKTWYQPRCYPGEPVFVAAPDAAAEDDGVILSVVLDSQTVTSFLLILDAKTFAELARAEVTHHIPFGFHGNYFSSRRGEASLQHIHR